MKMDVITINAFMHPRRSRSVPSRGGTTPLSRIDEGCRTDRARGAYQLLAGEVSQARPGALDLFPEVHRVEHVAGSRHVSHLRFRSVGVGPERSASTP